MNRRRAALSALMVLAVAWLVPGLIFTPAQAVNLFGSTKPGTVSDVDPKSVELGVTFSSSKAGTVTAIRFYKGPSNVGKHVGSLWTEGGRRLATTTFSKESTSGWQTAKFSTPVKIAKNTTYVASYLAPKGRYSADNHGFDRPFSRSTLTVPAGGGVYSYGNGGFPKDSWQNSNYYVDVVFEAAKTASPSPGPTKAPTVSPTKSPTAAPTTVPPIGPDGGVVTTLSLPRIPWEGGSGYWKKFPKTAAAGWSDPSFFPIAVWFNGISSDSEAQYDKGLGVNTYIGMWEGTPYHLFEDNDVYWIGGKLNDTFTDGSKNWVGDFLDDEVDGRFTPADGRAHLAKLLKPLAGDGRFKYANFTQMIMSNDMSQRDAERYVNDYTDAVSIDMYYYTIPYCSLRPYRDVYVTPVAQSNCRTASSYGKTMDSLRKRDAQDGELQALWQFVENVNGGPGEGPHVANVTGGQVQGAVMSSVINEARGIVYFNQSFTGSCTGGSLFRQSQTTPNFCGAAQVAGAKTVNLRIKTLAPVLNTQSYEYRFGSGLDTMLKAYDKSVYVFAMVDGSTKPGQRTFTLPAEVKGRDVSVMFENRTIKADAKGQFTDTFAAEYSYHVYKITK